MELSFFQWLSEVLNPFAHRTPWLAVLLTMLLGIYLAALAYKILHAEEGFILGYKGWVLGKWTKPPRRLTVGRPSSSDQPLRRLRLQNAELEASGRLRKEIILLSRLLDGDLAYLMVNERAGWEPKLQRLLQSLVSGVSRVVHSEGEHRCGFFILEEDGAHLVLSVGEGYQQQVRLPVDFSCVGRAFQTGETYYCRDLTTDPIWSHLMRGFCQYRSVACFPVRAGQVVWGVLCMEAEEAEAFSTDDLMYLEMFAAKLAVICSFHSLQISG